MCIYHLIFNFPLWINKIEIIILMFINHNQNNKQNYHKMTSKIDTNLQIESYIKNIIESLYEDNIKYINVDAMVNDIKDEFTKMINLIEKLINRSNFPKINAFNFIDNNGHILNEFDRYDQDCHHIVDYHYNSPEVNIDDFDFDELAEVVTDVKYRLNMNSFCNCKGINNELSSFLQKYFTQYNCFY